MQAVTVCQPWAWAIVSGAKRVENRSWPVRHRGPLLIHAGKSRRWLEAESAIDWPAVYGVELPAERDLVFGAVLGAVNLVACLPIDGWERIVGGRDPAIAAAMRSPWACGPWCWVLADPRPLAEPVPYRGAQGLFPVTLPAVAGERGTRTGSAAVGPGRTV